jgi:hypothetical protein
MVTVCPSISRSPAKRAPTLPQPIINIFIAFNPV